MILIVADTGSSVEHTCVLRNEADVDLEILKVRPACGCTAANLSDKIIPPGGPIWAIVHDPLGTFDHGGLVPIWRGQLPELRHSEEHGHDVAVITDDDGVDHEFATVGELVDYILSVKEWPSEPITTVPGSHIHTFGG